MDEYYIKVRKILRVILVLNLIVAAIKIYFGWKSWILSITTDGYDSFFDAVANIVGIFAVIIASRLLTIIRSTVIPKFRPFRQ